MKCFGVKMMTRRFLLCVLFGFSLFLAGCSTSVKRVDSGTETDLSGAWNDTDSRLVSDEMIADALSRPWYSNFRGQNGHIPAVIVGSVVNLGQEIINTRTFITDMERSLINSGKVDFVASKEQREEVRDERVDQDLNATEATRNQAGQELGADFIVRGEINTIFDLEGKQAVKFYQVDLTMISLANNRKVWIGQKKIKKIVKKKALRL
jgi:PBP1b-binding outer membrane lipoprotein LpoB